MAEVRMPKMGDGMEEGRILRWLKNEGDTVAADESIAEIETDKANVEMPAEEPGVLTKIFLKAGETAVVGAIIGFIGDASSTGVPVAAIAQAPIVERPAIASNGHEQIREAKLPADASGRVRATPLARKRARELGIELQRISGSGPGGRIVERDVVTVSASRMPQASPHPPLAALPSLASPVAPTLGGADTEISRMRRAIARRTVQSKQTIPHFYLVMPIEMDRSLAMLDEMNAQVPEGKVTVNDLIVKACAVGLATFPDVNVSFTPDEKIRRYDTINIGVAVGTDAGLTIPVIPDCGNKTLRDISTTAKALIAKARSGSLTPQEMSGGTMSVSNLGMFGIEEFAAIINPPESVILAVGAVAAEVVVGAGGAFEARRRMRVTLSCDHRAVDGLLGARFLQEVRRLLENPFTLLA